MKRKFLIVCILLFCLTLTSCVWKEPPFSQEVDQIEYIELMHYKHNSSYEVIKSTLLYTIKGNEIAPFIEKVSALDCRALHPPGTEKGEWEFNIYYNNGDIDMIGDNGDRFVINGRRTYDGRHYYREEDLIALFSEYVDVTPYLED